MSALSLDAHSAFVADGLRNVELKQMQPEHLHQQQGNDGQDHEQERGREQGQIDTLNVPSGCSTPSRSRVRDGYGFRPSSGASTPITSQSALVAGAGTGTSTSTSLPDPNGLGWPGTVPLVFTSC
jgi:GTP cyclohydrolase IA